MTFRSAAAVVVARIFKLVDSNGFTRLFFGSKTLFGQTVFALVYEDPNWTDPDTESGVLFGTSVPDISRSSLYAIGISGDTTTATVVTAQSTDNAGTRLNRATMQSLDNTTVTRTATINVDAQSSIADQAQISLAVQRAGATGGSVTLTADATRSELLIVADRMGPWTAVAGGVGFAANFANAGGAFQAVQYRKIGDMVQIRGVAITTAPTGAGATIFTLPAGFRPAATERFIAVDTAVGGVQPIDITAAGAINVQPGLGAGAICGLLVQFYTST